MGTTGSGSFSNDAALDLVVSTTRAGAAGLGGLRRAIAAPVQDDASSAQRAIAAAALMARSRDARIWAPAAASRWVLEHGTMFGPEDAEVATGALGLVLDASELRDLWADSPDLGAWVASVRAVQDALRQGFRLEDA